MGEGTKREKGKSVALLIAARDGDQEARDQLIEEYLDLVMDVSREMAYRFQSRVEEGELYGIALEGLLDAIARFDENRMHGFKSFCRTRIRGAILDEVRRNDSVPRSERLRVRRIEEAYSSLCQKHGRPPTEVELANDLGLAFDSPRMMRGRALRKMVMSYTELAARNQNMPRGLEGMVDPESDESGALDARDAFDAMLRGLSEKERTILRAYYGEGHSMREIGLMLGICESRVSQIHKNVLARLQSRVSDESEEPRATVA